MAGDHYFDDPRLHRRPSTKALIQTRWIDYSLGLALIIALGALYLYWKSSTGREFLIVDPKISRPWVENPIPIWAHALFVIGFPLAVFALFSLFWIRSFWDLHNAGIGLGFALSGSSILQFVLKKTIGSLRPHFIAVCQPDWERVRQDLAKTTGGGLLAIHHLWYDKSICMQPRAELLEVAFESFPSGHTTGSFASMVFLMLYLNGKLKVWGPGLSDGYKLALVMVPFGLACVSGGIMYSSGWHHWHDVYAGMVIGTLFAFAAYRMAFASVWDSARNHLPLLHHRFSEEQLV